MMWNVVIGGMGVSPERGLAREQELKSTDQFWGGSKVCRHQGAEASAFVIVDHIIAQPQPVVLSIQRQMVDEHGDVDETDAGKYLRRNVIQEQEKVRDRLARSSQELDEKLEAQEADEVEEVSNSSEGTNRSWKKRPRVCWL